MLEDSYKAFRRSADAVNWKDYNCNDLFFEYIKHENDNLRDNFLSGIICRYWGYAGRVYTQCERHIPFEECYDCVIDTIKYVLAKRVWENPNSSLYGDKRGPDKAFHVALKRQRAIMLTKYNAQKRVSNFNTLSIDGFREEYNDASEGILFNLQSSEYDHSLKSLICEYFEKGDYISGILLDTICYQPYVVYTSKGIISYVKNIKFKDFPYYSEMYYLDEKLYKKAINEIFLETTHLLELRLNTLLYELKEGVYDN